MDDRELDPRDLDYTKKITREVLFETESDSFPYILFGLPAYSYERPEVFVEFDTTDDPDYLGRAFIRWSAVKWLSQKSEVNTCDICGEQRECIECNACEFDLSPFRFQGPCRFQERESRNVCGECLDEIEQLVDEMVLDNPGSFVAREI